MRHVRLLILLMLAGPAAGGGPLVLTDPGAAYEPGSLPSGGGWLALECGPGGCALRATGLQLSRQTVLHLDEFRVPLETPRVKGRPLALLHGLALSPGPLARGRAGRRPRCRATATARALDCPGGCTAAGPVVGVPARPGWRHDAAVPVCDGVRGPLRRRHDPRVLWAGDLDGDGRADLLFSLPDDNCGFDNRLYLSSAAGPGRLVGLAAHFAGRHPACGC